MGSRLEKNSESTRKRIEGHTFEDEEGEEYEGSKFGGFPEYFRRKKIKLQNLDAEVRSQSTGNPPIFRGVVAQVNGYTQPSLRDLHHLIVSYGGGFMQYLDGKTSVTHIIAANLTPKKAIEFRKYRIVKPAWVVDSVAAGKLLPWDAYRVLDEGSGQRVLGFEDGKVMSQMSTKQIGYREQTNTSWYTSQVEAVAKDIDNEDGSQLPSTQAVTMHGLSDFTSDASRRLGVKVQTEATTSAIRPEDLTSSAESFEVTSSLEDVLDNPISDDKLSGQEESPEAGPVLALPETSIQDSEKALRMDNGYEALTDSPSLKAKDMSTSDHALSPPEDKPQSPAKDTKVMTAEEHNALLLTDPHMRKSSTANPDFIQQYYSESRLHHLSMWKAELKSRFQQMAAEKSASQMAVPKRKPGARRYIMHVDFDSFFCAVSLKQAPEYVDKPAVVAHGSGVGSEIASCNYPARAFGIKNGMWMKTAHKLCPNIKVLSYDFPAYEETSKMFYEAIIDVGGIVQSVSVDEALVDITSICLQAAGSDGVGINEGSIWREQEKADDIGQKLRKSIKKRTGCEVSIGIGGNILLAKVALRKAKPAGQYHIKPEQALDFLSDLTIQDLPGYAHSIGGKLEEIGVKYVKDVRELTKDRLMTVLGPKTGQKLWDYSRGIDKTEVGEQAVRKSVSAEVNWGIRFISQPEAEEFVQNLCNELQRRLLAERVRGRQLTMKIMRKAADAPLDPPKNLGHGKCDTFNKSIVLGVATNSAQVIGKEAIMVLRSYGFSPGELRGLGVQMTKLEPIKLSNTMPDGSQRRINFGVLAPGPRKSAHEDIIDDHHPPQTPKKAKSSPLSFPQPVVSTVEDPIDESITPQKPRVASSRLSGGTESIDDLDSPQKTKATNVHPAAAIVRANATDHSAKKLNIFGTQFVIPTQIDPSVLAELPQDIRSKLIAQSKSRPSSRSESPANVSRSGSPIGHAPPALPSQLDPEVFEALPEDMKAEVLASYASHAGPSRGQSLLPQSPRKVRTINLAQSKRTTPTKKKRGRPLGWRAPPKEDPHSSLLQSNFIAHKRAGTTALPPARHHGTASKEPLGASAVANAGAGAGDGYSSDTLDPDFLAVLPPDVRDEVVAEHKRQQLAKRHSSGGGGVLTTALPAAHKKRKDALAAAAGGQRKLRLAPREARPTFTTHGLSSLEELRQALSAWHGAFRGEGPHLEDVGALERYLRRVVLEERDLAKVVGVVGWLGWLVEEEGEEDLKGEGERDVGKETWMTALEGVKEKVQEAVKERGLGELRL